VSARPGEDARGFALLAVLLVLGILGVLGAEFAYSMRLEATAVRGYKDGIIAGYLAEAAVAQASKEIVADWAIVTADEDGELSFYTRDRVLIPRAVRRDAPLGAGFFTYRLRDEESLLNLNTSQPGRIEALLQALGLQKNARDAIVDSIQDWRDPNDEHRLSGAESDDYYLKLPVPYRARNANLDSTFELLQIKGITPELFYGAGGQPGLRDVVTVRSVGQININTVGPVVLRALGLSEAEITTIIQTRRETPYAVVPGPFAGRGLTVTTRTFRVQAEGIVNGRVAARLTAVVRRQGDGAVSILEWSGVQ
jgi:general secretion pathway protein K